MIQRPGNKLAPKLFLELTKKWFTKKEDLDKLEQISKRVNRFHLFNICLLLSIAVDHDPKKEAHRRLLHTFFSNRVINPTKITVIRLFLIDFLKLPPYILEPV